MHKKHIISLMIAILLPFFHWQIKGEAESRSYTKDPVYSIPRRIHYSFTIWNSTDKVIKDAEFWTCAPVKETSTQQCVDLTASHPYRIVEDPMGNRFLCFSLKELAPYALKIISIEADLMLSKIPNSTPLNQNDSYLNADQYCESDNHEIISLAEALKREDTQKTAKNIFKWVSGNIQYTGYTSNIRGALYALKNRKGDCTEFMSLFTALCRANRIYARMLGGYICADNSILKPNGYHNWAEFYLNGTWAMADPQKNNFMKNQSNYIAMRYIDGAFMDSPGNNGGLFGCSGKGIKVKMNG